MDFLNNAVLGSAFLVLAIFLTFLMFYLWKFPFDKEKHRSSAPRSLMNLHRLLGYLFVVIYVYLMWDMVPRLWSYQIELPARTVLHLTLGIAIGGVLLIKIMVVRYFKHMEAKLAPYLGTSLLIFTILLTGLALPYSAREAYLSMTAQDGQNFAAERLERVRKYLPQVGFEDSNALDELASTSGLIHGRTILTKKCTQCHDMRTILAKPRTPDAWHKTVVRMANRSTVLNPISESEQWKVTAYLIAISPTLRETVSNKNAQSRNANNTKYSLKNATQNIAANLKGYTTSKAQSLFENKCGQCHSFTLVENNPPSTSDGVVQLVSRMVSNGLTADESELAWIMTYLKDKYAKDISPPVKVKPIKDTPAKSNEDSIYPYDEYENY